MQTSDRSYQRENSDMFSIALYVQLNTNHCYTQLNIRNIRANFSFQTERKSLRFTHRCCFSLEKGWDSDLIFCGWFAPIFGWRGAVTLWMNCRIFSTRLLPCFTSYTCRGGRRTTFNWTKATVDVVLKLRRSRRIWVSLCLVKEWWESGAFDKQGLLRHFPLFKMCIWKRLFCAASASCRCWAMLLWLKEGWSRKQHSQFISWVTFQSSHMGSERKK